MLRHVRNLRENEILARRDMIAIPTIVSSSSCDHISMACKVKSVDVRKRLESPTAMTAKRHHRLRSEKLGLHFDEATKAPREWAAPLERPTVCTSNIHRAAWRQDLRAEIRDPLTPQMRNAAESPPRFASVCFPPASPAFAPEAGKQKKTPQDSSQPLICLKKIGAGEGIRTLDPDLGKVVLYP